MFLSSRNFSKNIDVFAFNSLENVFLKNGKFFLKMENFKIHHSDLISTADRETFFRVMKGSTVKRKTPKWS